MSSPLYPQKEKTGRPPDAGRRRSMRVLLSIPVTASGKTSDNKDFKEETHTLVVNAHGALISLGARLRTGDKITIANPATQQSQECRIAYLGNSQAGKTQMGVEFINPAPSFWHIDFPPDDWVVPEN